MLRGQLVDLRSVEPDDYVLIWEWLNNPDVMQFWGRAGNTQSRAEVAAEEAKQSTRATSHKYIVQTKDGVAIGQIDYYDLDWRHRSAWTSILIGNADFWGGGYGTDAMKTLLRYLFCELGLHRVSLNVHATNERAQRSYAKNGFAREGTMRDWQFVDGKWIDGIVMSVLEQDFMD